MSGLPPGAWDCHAHVIGDPVDYPLWPGRGYDPPAAPLAAYLALLDEIGVAHGVLVQPSVYGFDNRCMLDALDAAGGRLHGIAVPAPDATPRELEMMHRRGVRGVRCNPLSGGGLGSDVAHRWQPLLHELGWRVELHIDVGATDELRRVVDRFAVPVVIDHMGRPAPGRTDPEAPPLRALIELVRDDACFVKLSAPYRLSAAAAPWGDVAPLARALVAANPARCLWATDWPHTQMHPPPRPRDLLAALRVWCSDEQDRRTILVDTPATLAHMARPSPRSGG